ncbi:metallophosphoesterase [Longimicrobium sp.]|uniref:metallophosphoesterase n=1 Tax=Longimicrobium sp. TaxID=2029185 RepID=UPI003B3BC7E8
MNRRRFVALAGGGAVAALAGDAWLIEPGRVQFTHHAVNARTSPEQRAVRFVQLTDLHLQQVGRMHRRIAVEINRLAPDFIVLTGDSVDRADRLGELSRFLGMLDRAVPRYAILGNWEHWARVNLDELDSLYRAANCRLLINDRVVHRAGGRSIRLTGIDDLVGGRPDAWKALAGSLDADAHVVLAHCPEHRDRLVRMAVPRVIQVPASPRVSVADATLVLSGHTHGGQVSLFGWSPVLPRGTGPYVRGWFREPGAPPMYVSRGIGTSMVPVRLGARPEVAVFTLWV